MLSSGWTSVGLQFHEGMGGLGDSVCCLYPSLDHSFCGTRYSFVDMEVGGGRISVESFPGGPTSLVSGGWNFDGLELGPSMKGSCIYQSRLASHGLNLSVKHPLI